MRLPLNIPSLEDESHAPTNLSSRIQAFCKDQKEKRKHEWESIKVVLEKMKESKGKSHKQQVEEERDACLFTNGAKCRKNESYGEEFNKQSVYYFG